MNLPGANDYKVSGFTIKRASNSEGFSILTAVQINVVKGTPSLEPIVPPTPGDSMALYELFVPAYTFDASEITTKYIDNRRYTM